MLRLAFIFLSAFAWQVPDNSLKVRREARLHYGMAMSNSEQEQIYQMFDRIAPTYDKVNRLLSCGRDEAWRKAVAQCIPSTGHLAVLDIATGTADLLLSMCRTKPHIREAVGIDLSENMLALGRKKAHAAGFFSKVDLIHADARSLPFAALSFDVVTNAFGIRNIVDQKRALNEMERVLKPNGLILILEFSLPINAMLRPLYLAYFRHVLPLVGGLISRDFAAYRYLNRTVEQFPTPEQFSQRLHESGFISIVARPLTFGIATLYSARKAQ